MRTLKIWNYSSPQCLINDIYLATNFTLHICNTWTFTFKSLWLHLNVTPSVRKKNNHRKVRKLKLKELKYFLCSKNKQLWNVFCGMNCLQLYCKSFSYKICCSINNRRSLAFFNGPWIYDCFSHLFPVFLRP